MLDGEQYCDFIIDSKLSKIILLAECNNKIFSGQNICIESSNKFSDDIQLKLYVWLCQTETLYNRQQYKVLIKQNIFGLYRINFNPKLTTFTNVQSSHIIDNFIYPVKNHPNINKYNLQGKYEHDELSIELYNRYKNINVIETSVNIIENQNIKKEQKILQVFGNDLRLKIFVVNLNTINSIVRKANNKTSS